MINKKNKKNNKNLKRFIYESNNDIVIIKMADEKKNENKKIFTK